MVRFTPQSTSKQADFFFATNRSMLRDESVYLAASTFKPERLMEVDLEKQK